MNAYRDNLEYFYFSSVQLSEKDGVYGFHPDLFEQLNTLGHIPDEAMTPINELAVACRIESPDEYDSYITAHFADTYTIFSLFFSHMKLDAK